MRIASAQRGQGIALAATVIVAWLVMTISPAYGQPPIEPNPVPPETAQPQMERLIHLLEGRWTTRAAYAPSPGTPNGASSVGWEQSRVGPSRASIILETESHGTSGTFEGAGFIVRNGRNSTYDLYWLSSSSRELGIFAGRWSGADVVFDGYEYVAERQLASRHSITNISADAFVYTIDMGPTQDRLTRAVTIDYTRV